MAALNNLILSEMNSVKHPPAVFCDKSFKKNRLYLNAFFNPSLKSYLDFSAFNHFKDRLIEPTMNSPAFYKEAKSEGLKGLEEVYGTQIRDWIVKESPHWGCDQNFLRPLDLISGCCVGMSLHFIKCYLEEVSRGSRPLDAVKKVASLYTYGAPIGAQLLHIITRSRKSKKINLIKNVFMSYAFLALFISDLVKRIFNFQEMLDGDSFGQKFRRFVERKCFGEAFSPTMIRIVPKDVFHIQEKGVRKIPPLLPGAYQICAFPEKGNGHSIVFIKAEEGPDFLFDPNNGVLRVDRPEQIFEPLEELYLEDLYNLKIIGIQYIMKKN